MACGVPILGTDSGVLVELVEHEKQGFLVPRHSPAGIVDLAAYVNMVPEIDRSACRDRALKFHSSRMAEEYADLYDRVARGGRWES